LLATIFIAFQVKLRKFKNFSFSLGKQLRGEMMFI